jgi:putative colanic acid biosynthesis acetyltransferase WcaF
MSELDIASNRAAQKWTRKELVGRAAWGLAHPVFACSPRIFWAWRRGLLRVFGAKIGHNVHIYPSVRIAVPWNLDIADEVAIGDRAIVYNLGPVKIGAQATISQGVHLSAGTHDYRRADMPLLKPPIEIGPAAWICADAFIGPGVTVGEFAIVGARTVVMKDVEAGMIVAGNPMRALGKRPKFEPSV